MPVLALTFDDGPDPVGTPKLLDALAALRARDTCRALSLLGSVGVTPTLWRTPWGDLAPFSAEIAAEHDLRLIGWTADTHDWRGDPAHEMFAALVTELRDGAIVLAHDGIGPGAQRETVVETIAFVELAAGHASQAGLTLDALQ